jgi:hypothetical protein
MANAEPTFASNGGGPADLLLVHRRGYQDAMAGRAYPLQYDTWEHATQLNYELGRARYAELKGLRGRGVRWGEHESLKAAVKRALGEYEGDRFNAESLKLFLSER